MGIKYKETTKQIQIRYCDVCNKNRDQCAYGRIKACLGCGIDVCYYCSEVLYTDFYLEDLGDYPNFCCKQCYRILHKYYHKFERVNAVYTNTVNKIEKRWQEECIKNRNEKNVRT